MTLLVDVGLVAGAALDPTWFVIGSPTQGIIGTNVLAPSNAMASYSDRVMAMAVQRTSSRSVGPLVEYNAGTATVTLLNDDGALDPYALEQAGLTAPGVILRIRKRWAGTTYGVFYGFIDSWLPTHVYPTHATVTVTATDAFGRLVRDRTPLGSPVGSGENTGSRLHRILDSVGWPSTMRAIGVGDTLLQATSLAGSALSEAQDAVRTEAGEFYVRPSGVVWFRGRHDTLTETQRVTSQGTFGLGVGEIPYVDRPGMSYDREQLVNIVSATREGGAEQVAQDAESVGRYGEYATQVTGLLHTNDTETARWARFVVNQTSDPELRYTSLTLDARADEANIYPQVLGRNMGDRITVVRRPPAVPWGSVVDSRDVYIRGITHAWTSPNRWTTTWSLEPSDKRSYLILGHPQYGRLGYNHLAY